MKLKQILHEERLCEDDNFSYLAAHKQPLTAEERDEVMRSDAIWHHGVKGEPSPAVWKAVDRKGNVWYITNTHRAYETASSLKGAIKLYHSFIKGTA